MFLLIYRIYRCLGLFHITTFRPPQKEWSSFFVQNVAQCSETNEKSILRFLVFEIWSFKIKKMLTIWLKKNFIVPKDAQCSETDFLVFEIWSISYSKVSWGLRDFYEPDSETLTSDTR